MRKCISLAKMGAGYVSPNPMVGCVILKNNKIIGEGYHKIFGGNHAEVNAVNDAKKRGYSLKGADVFVNLEPCSHSGKTPPCTDLLISEKISSVYIGIKDSNKKVNGIKKLTNAGIKVKVGILKDECKELNKFFLKHITKNIPYVVLKIAHSIDGKIALTNNQSKYITGIESRKYVHQLRSEYDAVLIGSNTANLDNPELNVREVKGRDPLRIIIDTELTLKKSLKVFKDNNYLVLTRKKINDPNYLQIGKTNGNLNLRAALKMLAERSIVSLLVEGGSKIFSYFINNSLADELIVITAPKILGKGLSGFDGVSASSLNKAPQFNLYSTIILGNDILINYRCSQE